jgi:Uma2 family endonuclease
LTGTAHQQRALSVADFRAFIADRPDEERWELIEGAAVMMTPPTKVHQRIASNLQRLLLIALDLQAPHLTAYQRLGVNIGGGVEHYDPEPDVVVVDAAIGSFDERYADRFYLAAEIVSSADRVSVERKCDIYRRHPACRCVLLIRQDRPEIRVDLRRGEEWSRTLLTAYSDLLVVSEFGFRCTLAELYRGTPLQPA